MTGMSFHLVRTVTRRYGEEDDERLESHVHKRFERRYSSRVKTLHKPCHPPSKP